MGNYISNNTSKINEPTCITVKNEKKRCSQCDKCRGIGLMKTKFIVCPTCCGKKCHKCRELGYTQSNWSECDKCFGSGSLDKITITI